MEMARGENGAEGLREKVRTGCEYGREEQGIILLWKFWSKSRTLMLKVDIFNVGSFVSLDV